MQSAPEALLLLLCGVQPLLRPDPVRGLDVQRQDGVFACKLENDNNNDNDGDDDDGNNGI